MDKVIDVVEILRRETAFYHGSAYKATTFLVEDTQKQIFTVVIVPDNDYPTDEKASVVVLARLVDYQIHIEVDNTDHPLYDRLLEAGIPESHIVCSYLHL